MEYKIGVTYVEIRIMQGFEVEQALALIWTTFLKIDAPMFSPEGVDTFHNYLQDKNTKKLLVYFGAYEGGELKGVLASNRRRSHICLFFVGARHLRQGVGRRLWEYFQKNSAAYAITVNSAPYAVPVYHRFGFADSRVEQIEHGMRFTPMRYERGCGG